MEIVGIKSVRAFGKSLSSIAKQCELSINLCVVYINAITRFGRPRNPGKMCYLSQRLWSN